MSTRIHLYTICWNEEIMLPHFLNYYSSLCERIIVYDNFSDDGSEDICRSYPNVVLRKYQSNGEIRDDIYLQIKNNCWKESAGQADWVIVCDIDEFLYHPDLLSVLKEAKEKKISHFQSIGYEMLGNCVPNANQNLIEQIKIGTRRKMYDKTLLFDPNLIQEINYDWGAHSCLPIGSLKEDKTSLKLLHYKYLSKEYVAERYKALSTRLSKRNRKMNLGVHYFFNYRKIRKTYAEYFKNAERVFD